MAIIIPPPHAYVMTKDTIFSRGVFAGRNYKEGELIEICPILEFSLSDKTGDFPKKLEKSVFKWRILTGNSALPKYCLALGYGGIYSDHPDKNNVTCRSDEERDVIGFFAVRDILKDEELIIESRWRTTVAQMLPSGFGETPLNF